MTSLLGTALDMHEAGIAVVPIATDGTKRPAVTWKAYQDQAPGSIQLQQWFARPPADGGYDGLGVLTGPVSGQLELLELEGRAVTDGTWARFEQAARDNGFGDLLDRLKAGWLELSPSGGIHLLYRVDGPAMPNTKLARRPGTVPGTVDVLIETRGAGGFVVTAPSTGRSHPTGKPWVKVAGGHRTAPLITVEERDALYLLAGMFDEMPTAQAEEAPRRTTTVAGAGARPGDDYNARATWDDILTPHGWTRGHRVGGAVAWIRPGKSPRDGISATTGRNDADNLYVFTTSTEFETEKPYDKFGAYALLEHSGDIAAAARQLRADGYGAPLEEARHTDSERIDDLIAPSPSLTPAPTAVEQAATSTTDAPASVGEAPATYSLSDDGNALRLIDTHGHQLRYCPQRGQWLTWTGHRWRWDEAEHVNELARSIARGLTGGSKEHDRHRGRSLSTNGVLAMVRLARSDRRTVTHLDQLDAQPFQLNTPTGVVNLRTGERLQPDPTMLHTRSTTVAPAPSYAAGDAPRWERFLADTFAGDPDLTTYLQRVLGQALIGQVLEQILPFAYGAGANGKTTLLGVVQRLVGIGDQGYSISAPAELLLATANPGHPTEIARLAGARLVVTSELEDGQRFAEAKVKMLTGRDTISGRFMRQDWFSFTPTHTLFLLANHQPEVRAGGEAFWRRIALLPFLHTVPKELRNPHLEDQLVEQEGPQILAWIVQGAVDYLAHGIARPDSVEAATTSYATAQDTVGRFVEDCCQIAPPGTQSYSLPSSQLRQVYETWCRQEGETPVTAKALTVAITTRFGVTSSRTRNARQLDGIRLRPDLDASPDDEDDRDRQWR